jgi:hypothetical protein
MHPLEAKNLAIKLRRQGKTYGEIRKSLSLDIPKSTLSDWCNGILLSNLEKNRIQEAMTKGSRKGRLMALMVIKKRRNEYLESVRNRVKHLGKLVRNRNIAKITVGMLYLGEGSKMNKGHLTFANSDPKVIRLFLNLLRYSYNINETKFRCTVQCRADQKIEELERFWSKTTKIPRSQFYKTRIDPRSIGHPSRKKDYKGVCRIEYFSADLFNELLKIGEVICEMGL